MRDTKKYILLCLNILLCLKLNFNSNAVWFGYDSNSALMLRKTRCDFARDACSCVDF